MSSVIERSSGCPVMHLNLAENQPAGFHVDSASEYRDGGPVWVNTYAQGFWVLTSQEYLLDMYRQPDIFTNDSVQPHKPDGEFGLIPENTNPPAHRGFRALLNPWFAPAAVARHEDTIRRIARDLVSELARNDGADVVTAFALRLPTEAFLAFVGLPTERTAELVSWVEDIAVGVGGGPEHQQQTLAAAANVGGYFAEVFADRRKNPRDPSSDFFTSLMAAEVNGARLTDKELHSIALLLIGAGLDTTRAHLGWMLYDFATRPNDRARVIADPTLLPEAIEESLRLHAIITLGRRVAQDCRWKGLDLRAGDMVQAHLGAANKDHAVYDRADEFILDRKPNKHLSFSSGHHRCLGSHLARAELRIGIEEFHRQIPDYELASEADLIERGYQISLLSLPLKWVKAKGAAQ